jgi:hypothetical protein
MEICKKSGKPNFNGMEIGKQFFDYFYSKLHGNIDQFGIDGIITENTKLQFQSNTYIGMDCILFLKQLSSNLELKNCTYEIFDSGSRQIQILVTGNININVFSQVLTIIYMGEKNNNKWVLMNSILIIL